MTYDKEARTIAGHDYVREVTRWPGNVRIINIPVEYALNSKMCIIKVYISLKLGFMWFESTIESKFNVLNKIIMKAIVTSWIYPRETKYGADERPKSIERISTTIEDLKEYMNESQLGACFGDIIEFASSIATFDEPEIFANYDEIKRFWKGDGYEYLSSCLKENSLGRCVARVYHSKTYKKRIEAGKEIMYHYFLFQVRNIH